MIFNKEKKICLFQPPRTGTTTARNFLMLNGWNVVMPFHGTPDELITKYPNIKQYKMYCFFRNPLDRFLSCVAYCEEIEKVKFSKDIVDEFDWLFKPQSCWANFNGMNLLNFEKYEDEIRILSGLKNDIKYPINLKNSSLKKPANLSKQLFNFVRKKYFEDFLIFEKRIYGAC